MRTKFFLLIFFFAFAFFNFYGQATRTWVSGLGDDANPCSRTSPCKTFAGAISKTAIGGEINVIDPGGFGAVTITKSITLDGGGSFASILSSLTNGIIINADADAVVTIRHLTINGAGNGIDGIKITSAKKVQVEDCYLANFTQKGIEIITTSPCTVVINNVTIHNADDAIAITNEGGSVIVEACRFQSLTHAGVNVLKGQATVIHSNVSDCNLGIAAAANTVVALSNNIICNNVTGLQGPGKINSAGNNIITGNKTQGTVISSIKMQ